MAPSQRFDSARWPVFALVVAAGTCGADDEDSAYMPSSQFLPLLTVSFSAADLRYRQLSNEPGANLNCRRFPWRDNLTPKWFLRQFTVAFLRIRKAFPNKLLILRRLSINISPKLRLCEHARLRSELGAVWSHRGILPSSDSGPTRLLSTRENFARRVYGSGCSSNR